MCAMKFFQRDVWKTGRWAWACAQAGVAQKTWCWLLALKSRTVLRGAFFEYRKGSRLRQVDWCLNMHIYVYIQIHTYIHIYMHIYIYVYTHICTHLYQGQTFSKYFSKYMTNFLRKCPLWFLLLHPIPLSLPSSLPTSSLSPSLEILTQLSRVSSFLLPCRSWGPSSGV